MRTLTLSIIFLSFFSCSVTESLEIHKLRNDLTYVEIKKDIKPQKDRDSSSYGRVLISTIPKNSKIVFEIKDNQFIIKPYNIYTTAIQTYLIKESFGVSGIDGLKDKLEIPYTFAFQSQLNDLNMKMVKSDFSNPSVPVILPLKNNLHDSGFMIGCPIKLKQVKQILQPISIPFKIHLPSNDVKEQISTGINLSVGYSFKSIYKSYLPVMLGTDPTKLIGHNIRTFDFSITPIAGITVIDLTDKNTVPSISASKKVFGLSTGVMGVVGILNFDLGIGLGIDHGFGNDAKSWNYQTKPWLGFAVGFDIYK